MDSDQQPAKIFSAARQHAKLDRAYANHEGDRFLWEHMASDIADRLSIVTRDFSDVLLIGPAGDYADILLGERNAKVTTAHISSARAGSRGSGDALIENDILPFNTGDFDLVICFGFLDTVNDLPGFLFQIRHLLRPDGLFLGSAFGAGTLTTLRHAMLMAEGDRAAQHIHPQIDLHNMSQLVVRAGFALPVVDQDQLQVRYSSLNALLTDLRNMGLGSTLSSRAPYFGKGAYSRLHSQWRGKADDDGKTDRDGKTCESFNFLHINGWSPSPDQPKPARRGSGQKSLADVLSPPRKNNEGGEISNGDESEGS